jgi:hypothetical protein
MLQRHSSYKCIFENVVTLNQKIALDRSHQRIYLVIGLIIDVRLTCMLVTWEQNI